jgi:hypothetical protein
MRRTARLGALGLLLLASSASPALAQEGGAASGDAQTAGEAPKREPITHIGGAAPTETLQERMERFKREKGAGSDKPFEGFATQAEQEMQRQREAAIGGRDVDDAAAEQSVESRIAAREKLQDALFELGEWGGSMCAEVEPAWSAQDDFIKHRKLSASDFLFAGDKSVAAVAVPKAAPTGFAAILFSCEIQPVVQQVKDKLFIARPARVRYYALLSRRQSWLAEHAESREAFVVGHQQLHFDMANAFAGWLNQNRERTLARMQGAGPSPEVAIGRLQLQWAEHMLAVYDDFDALETAFDRDTKHGAAAEKQTEWSFRLGDGFEALAKGIRLATRSKTK